MIEIVAKLSSKNQITVPVDVRRELGVKAADRITFVVDEQGVHIRPTTRTVRDLFGRFHAPPNQSLDLDREIEDAMEERADEIARRLGRQ